MRNRRSRDLYTAVVVAFLLTRVLFYLITTAGEYRLFKSYGDDVREQSLGDLYRNRDIEYPHLAVGFGAVVGWVADHSPGFLKHTVRLRPNKFEIPYAEESEAQHDADDQYEATLGLVLFIVDAWCFWLVFAIARRIYPSDSPPVRALRLFAYVLFTSSCGLILFDRQDLVLAWVALLAVWCLAADYARLGYAVLAFGAAYKLIPVLLLPVWCIAGATAKCPPGVTPLRWVLGIGKEAVIAGAMLAAWPLLTYFCGGGERGFLYLTWHTKRGLQLEAPAAFPVLLVDSTVEFGSSYGSFNLRGELPDRVARFMGLMMPLSSLAGMAVAARGFWQRRDGRDLVPWAVVSAMLIWLAFIAFNKVGSPQYMLWIAPLAPLLPWRTLTEWKWAAVLLLGFFDTMVIYPCRYRADLVGDVLYEDPRTWYGPSTFGVVLLGIKSVIVVACSVAYFAIAWRMSRGLRASTGEIDSRQGSNAKPGD
ncbi:MAG: hypothetical protein U0791_12165 [Gemmataceae bacterium]